MYTLVKKAHHGAKYLKIVSFRLKFEGMLPKKRNDDVLKLFPPEDFIPIALLVIGSRVLLEIDTATSKEFLKFIQNIFIPLYELDIEFWFYHYSP